MDSRLFGFIFCALFIGSYSQSLFFDCPAGWVFKDKRCYQFGTKPVIYEEAHAACWMNGSSLVNVDSIQKHTFIRGYLTANDFGSRHVWFTGGKLYRDTVIWSGTGEDRVSTGPFFWLYAPGRNERFSVIAYDLGGIGTDGYGWRLVSGSVPSNYICEIPQSEASNIDKLQRGFDYGLGFVDTDDIEMGPKITTDPQSLVVAGETTSVHMDCYAEANPYPTYTWWRGTDEITQVTSETSSRYTLSGGRLTIQDPIEQEDGDNYFCKAANDQGEVESNFAHLMFGYLHDFSPVRPTDQFATAFEGTKLDCQAPSASPSKRYEWFKFTTNVFILPGHPYQFVSNSGLLYFSEVQPTDEKKYYCVVSLAAQEPYVLAHSQPPSRMSLGMWLLVSGEKNDGNYGPIIYTHAFPSPPLRGRTIRLECIGYGTLPLYYSWRREDDRPMPKGYTISDLNRVLTIPNAQLDAEGGYICTCSRTGGVADKVLTVAIEAKPYFPHPIKDMLVDDGQRVVWLCNAVARPAPTYSWYKNGERIVEVPGQIFVIRNNLVIKSVVKDRDEGMYQCGATNAHGTTFSAGQLKVLSMEPNFLRHPLPFKTLAPLGGNVTIPCLAEGAPVPMVTWFKNNGNLNLAVGDLGSHLGMTYRNALIITDVAYSDQGSYRCEANNDLGTSNAYTNVEVIQGITLMNFPISQYVQVNTTAFFYCQAVHNIQHDLTYVWKFNGHILDLKESRHFFQGNQGGVNGLYITDAKFYHTGVYECEARTTLHTVSKSAILDVRGPPGMPAGIFVDNLSVTSYSCRLIWTVGIEIDHGSAIISFVVEAESHFHPNVWEVVAQGISAATAANEALTMGYRADQRTAVISNLIPNTGYRFRVFATNSYGTGQEASHPSTTIKIPATAPVLAPENVGGGHGSVGTLSVTWEALDISKHCGPGIGYEVFWKKLGENRIDWKKETVIGNKDEFTATVGADNYYLEYEVKVRAFNDFGPGPNSTTQIIFSSMGIPIGVPMIQDAEEINSTAIMVYWIPVPDDRDTMKGRVSGYTIQYFGDFEGDFNPLDSKDPDFITNKEVLGQKDHATVIGLEPETNYYCRVQVVNSAGRGPKGEWRLAETLHFAPRLYPRHVKVYPRTMHSVIVHWRGISTASDEESLLGYKLRVYKVQEDIRTATDTITSKVNEAVVYELQMDVVYVVRVLGYSLGGDGALSEPVYFTVFGQLTNVPIDPTTSHYCFGHEGRLCGSAGTIQASALLVALLLILHYLAGNQSL